MPLYDFAPRSAAKTRWAGASFILRVVAVLLVGVVAVAVVTRVLRLPSSSKARPVGYSQQVSFFSLRAGACFLNPGGQQLLSSVTTDVTAVRCTSVHNAQIFAQFRAAQNGPYPGRSALVREGDKGCGSRVGALDRARAPRTARVITLFPNSASWWGGRRTISCVVFDAAGQLTTSLLVTHGASSHSPARPVGPATSAGATHRSKRPSPGNAG